MAFDINRAVVKSEEVIDFLKQEMLLKGISQRIVEQKLIDRSAKERNVTVSGEEMEAEANRIRYQQRLVKAEDTLAWLASQMVTADDWEKAIYHRLLARKLAENLFESEVENFFAQNLLDFERFVLYQIIVPSDRLALEILYQIEEEEICFYQAANLYDIEEQRRYRCGYEGIVSRWNLRPDIAAVLFGVPTGQIVGPVKTEQGYHILKIQKYFQAELTPQIRQEIIDRLFREWLDRELKYLLQIS